MKIYISGPMTGLPDLNFAAFNAEAARLRALGYDVVNPAEINPDPNADWLDCIIEDLKHLRPCGAIAMLPGWEASDGATVERIAAKKLRLHIVHAHEITGPEAFKGGNHANR